MGAFSAHFATFFGLSREVLSPWVRGFFEPSTMKSSSSSRAPRGGGVAGSLTPTWPAACELVLGLDALRMSYGHHTVINQRPKQQQNNNNNNTIWGGSVLTGEEPPLHSGKLKHALPQAGGPTQSQLSRPMSSGHHISMEHRLRRKQLNSDTNASNKNI